MSRKFEIISKKNLPDEANIKGFSFLKEPSEKEVEQKKYDFVSVSNSLEIGCFKNKRSSYAMTKGYVKVDDTENDYIDKTKYADLNLVGNIIVPYMVAEKHLADKFRLCVLS